MAIVVPPLYCNKSRNGDGDDEMVTTRWSRRRQKWICQLRYIAKMSGGKPHGGHRVPFPLQQRSQWRLGRRRLPHGCGEERRHTADSPLDDDWWGCPFRRASLAVVIVVPSPLRPCIGDGTTMADRPDSAAFAVLLLLRCRCVAAASLSLCCWAVS